MKKITKKELLDKIINNIPNPPKGTPKPKK